MSQAELEVLPDEGAGRWIVRHKGVRVGLVIGAKSKYNAETAGGRYIDRANTVMGAAAHVLKACQDKEGGN